jgi:hypothetical protein
MKAVGIAFAAGVLGVLIGTLAAQGPADPVRPGSEAGIFLYEGQVEALSIEPERDQVIDHGTVRVYENWVLLVEERRFVPREDVRLLKFQQEGGDRRSGDFGDRPRRNRDNDPSADRPQDRPGRKPNTFQEDK